MKVFLGSVSVVFGIVFAGSAAADPINLVQNGDFENLGSGGAYSVSGLMFSSDYARDDADNAGATAGTQLGAGYFGLVTDSHAWHSSFAQFGDHTSPAGDGGPGTGHMMIVNGFGSDHPSATVWSQSIAVATNTQYTFSFWARSAYSSNPATLDVTTVNIAGLNYTAQLTASTGSWAQFSVPWTSPNSTPVSISIVDTNTNLDGNDFAIDDISLIAVPLPPAAWAGLSTLAGVAGFGYIRRRKLNVG